MSGPGSAAASGVPGPPPVRAAGGWLERWRDWRDRRIADPRFQRWASGFVLTRGVARGRARALFDVVAGFVYSQVLLACVRLDLFNLLAAGPLSAREIGERCRLAPEAAQRLIDAAVSLQLLAPRAGGRYGLGALGAPMVGHEALHAMVEHHATLYRDLADPLALLRSGGAGSELGEVFAYANAAQPGALGSEQVAAYSALMTASQPLVAQEILAAWPMQQHRCLLDVAGGEGRFLAAAAERHAHLKLMLFDLPAVAERAQARFAAAGLGGRAQAHGGDFLADPLPRGADIATLIRVAHDHDDARVMHLLRSIRAALPDDGVLLLAEPMSGTAGAEPMGDAYFGFYLLAMGRGRPRRREQLAAMLAAAGFDRIRPLRSRLPLQVQLLAARAAPVRG